jgi:hypothetical protein
MSPAYLERDKILVRAVEISGDAVEIHWLDQRDNTERRSRFKIDYDYDPAAFAADVRLALSEE